MLSVTGGNHCPSFKGTTSSCCPSWPIYFCYVSAGYLQSGIKSSYSDLGQAFHGNFALNLKIQIVMNAVFNFSSRQHFSIKHIIRTVLISSSVKLCILRPCIAFEYAFNVPRLSDSALLSTTSVLVYFRMSFAKI